MMRLTARFGWIGYTLLVVSVVCLVYSGGSFTHAGEVQMASQMMEKDHHTNQVTRQDALPCQDCPTMKDEHQMHCGAPILVLGIEISAHRPTTPYDVPAHKVRDLIAQIFTPDPPPPRNA